MYSGATSTSRMLLSFVVVNWQPKSLNTKSDLEIYMVHPANDPETSGLHYYASAQDVEAGSFVSRGTAVHLSHSKSAPHRSEKLF